MQSCTSKLATCEEFFLGIHRSLAGRYHDLLSQFNEAAGFSENIPWQLRIQHMYEVLQNTKPQQNNMCIQFIVGIYKNYNFNRSTVV